MHARLLFKIMMLSLAFGLGACGSGSSESAPAGGAGTTGAAGTTGGAAGAGGAGASGTSTTTTPAASGPNGLFEVHYMSATATADIGGKMWDGPLADLVVWEKKKTDGDCALYMPRTPFCESCLTGQVCVETNVCRAQPTGRSVGNATLTGLTSSANPLPLTFVADGYLCAESLTVPPCTVGSAVKFDASGAGEYPAFSIQSKCIEPLKLATTSATLESGKAFTLTWTPGTVADARITLEFDLSHHGGSKGQIRCETGDTGSLQVSASLMKSLIDLGVTGFPWLTVARVAKGTAPVGSGQAQFKVYSDEKISLELPGLKSCGDDSACPTGQTCLIPSYMCGVACTSNTDCPTGQTCQASTKSCK